MTAETIHTCSYECERPECIRAQRDELAARMTAETSNARWELRMTDIREDAREPLQLLREKLVRDEDGWAALCELMPMLAAAPPPADARGDVRYDRELIAQMLDAAEAPAFTMEEMDTQARLLREAAQAKPEARGVVDEGSRSVTSQLLHWGGIPVRVTGTVTTSPGNWPLIDAALTEARNG